MRNHNGDLLLSFRFLSPSSPPLFHSSLPLLFSSLPSYPLPSFSLSGGKQGKEWSGVAWEEGTAGDRDERRDLFRVHLLTGGVGGGEEERIRVSGERKEAASIKEEVSNQSDASKQLQGVKRRDMRCMWLWTHERAFR